MEESCELLEMYTIKRSKSRFACENSNDARKLPLLNPQSLSLYEMRYSAACMNDEYDFAGAAFY